MVSNLASPAFLTYLGALVVAALFASSIAVWVYRRDSTIKGKLFVALLGAQVGWALLTIVSLFSPRGLQIPIYLTSFAFSMFLGPTWFVFSLYYTDNGDWLTRPRLGFIAVVYLLQVGFVLTNPVHNLIFTGHELSAVPFEHFTHQRGPLYRPLLTLVTFAFDTAGIVVLLRYALRSRRLSRRQTLVMLNGPVPAMVGQTILEYRLFGLPVDLEYGLLGLVLFGTLEAWALFQYDLFGIAPLARETVLDSTRQAVVILDPNRRVLDFNAAAVELFPDLEDSAGRRLDDVVPVLVGRPDASDESAFEEEIQVFDQDDQRRAFRVRTISISEGEDRQGYALVVKDRTEQEQYAEQLEQEAQQLDQFANAVSNDLRSPITDVRTTLRQADDDVREDIEDLVDRMETIIDDALVLARSGRSIDDRELASLSTIADRAWETSDTADATFDLQIEDDVLVYTDPTRLQRAFENLFRNAVDHGPEDVTITVGTSDDQTGFYVEDDGPGIPESERDDVFEQGFTTAADGTGLGLSIVKTIADAHGWTVRAEDGTSGGARFAFGDVELVRSGSTQTETREVPAGQPA